jgi:3-hydroxyacyl-CoA dehydrogenase
MSDSANPVRYEAEGDFALICIDNPPVNASSQAVRAGLLAAMERFAAAPEKVAVIYGAGRTFVAGADITEFGKTPKQPYLPARDRHAGAAGRAVVCVMHGTTLGGGLEIALGAHYRVDADAVRKLGLPEVNLGILPGAGGTQRLPRLCGLLPAAEIITSARRSGPKEALELGIVDAVSEEDAAKSPG